MARAGTSSWRWALLSVALISLISLTPTEARACSCSRSDPPWLNADEYDIVFAGRLLGIDAVEPLAGDPDIPVGIWLVEVERAWKGELEPVVELRTTLGAYGCGMNFYDSRDRWMLYAHRQGDGEYWVSRCAPHTSTQIEEHIAGLTTMFGPGREPVAWVAPELARLERASVVGEPEPPPPLGPSSTGCAIGPSSSGSRRIGEPSAPLLLLLALGLGCAWLRPRRRASNSLVVLLGLSNTTCVASPAQPSLSTTEPLPVAVDAEPSCAPLPSGPTLSEREDAGKWGFVDGDGNFVIAPRYDAIESFEGDLARVKIGRGWGAIDREGTERIPAIWQALDSPSSGLVRAKAGFHHVELLDACGRKVLGPYLAIDYIGERVVIAERRHDDAREWGLLDHAGEIVIPWSHAALTHEEFAIRQTPAAEEFWATPAFRRLFDLDGQHLFDWHGGTVEFISGGDYVIAQDMQGKACVLDRAGHERVACGEYRSFRALGSDTVSASTVARTVRIDLASDPPRVIDSD